VPFLGPYLRLLFEADKGLFQFLLIPGADNGHDNKIFGTVVLTGFVDKAVEYLCLGLRSHIYLPGWRRAEKVCVQMGRGSDAPWMKDE
jgi:hypothetical protein